MKGIACAVVFFLLVGIQSAYGSYIEHFERGRGHFYEERFAQAVVEFEESLRLNPLFDEIDIQLAREAEKYLEHIALEEEWLAEEIERLRAERLSRLIATEKIQALELEERIRLGIEEKERIRRLMEEEEEREKLERIEAERRELERPKVEIGAGVAITHIALLNLDFEHGNYPGRDPAPDGGTHKVEIILTDEHFTMQNTHMGFTLMPFEELSFTFRMENQRIWGSPYWTKGIPLKAIVHDTVNQLFPHIILPRTVMDITFLGMTTTVLVLDGTKAYKEYTDADYMTIRFPPPFSPMFIRIKPILTAARPMIVDRASTAIYDGLKGAGIREPTDPGVPDTRWRDIDLAYLEADLLGFKGKFGRQYFRVGLPVDVDVVTDLIGIGVVEEIIDMVIGHADAVVVSYRTPPIMGLVSPKVGAFGLKLDDADPGVCRIRSDHDLRGASLGVELSVAGALDALGLEFELPAGLEGVGIDIASASRIIRKDCDLRDEVQSDILRIPIAAYVRQSGRVGLWETDPDPETGKRRPWRHYTDGPRHWVRSKSVGGYAWAAALPIAVPGERMPFFAAIHKYRSGDNPATPGINEAFDPIPHDLLFFPIDPAALLGGALPIALPKELDIGTNMRYQLYAGGFMPGEGLIVGGLYGELDRVRLNPLRDAELRAMGVTPSGSKDFLQMAGLFSVFTWRDIGFTLAGIGIRPEDAAFDALEGMIREEIHIGGGLGRWAKPPVLPLAPYPEPLVRSKEWMRVLLGMITLAPTKHTSLIIGGAWIDPRDHMVNILDCIVYYDARGDLAAVIGGGIPGATVTIHMDPLERFQKPFMDEPGMAFFAQFAVHF